MRRVAAAITIVCAAACRRPTGPSTIPIGFYGSLTGTTATFGQSGQNGAVLAVEEANTAGGLLGKKLSLISEDDRAEPAEAASAVTKLISQDHVVALIGEAASSRTLAAAPIAQAARVPMITPTSTNPKVTEVGNYVFRACFTDDFQGRILARFARENLRAATAAILLDVKNDYSIGLADAFRREFTSLGGRIVAEQRYAEGDGDFSPQLTQIRPTGPDVLFVPGYYGEAGLIARQKKTLGVGGTLLGGDGWDSPRLVEIGGEAIDGAYFGNHYSSDDPDPDVARFVSAYKGRFGLVPDSIAALSYDSARLLFDAMRRAGSTDGPRVAAQLSSTRSFRGVGGTLSMDAHRNPVKSVVILRVVGGRYAFAQRIEPETTPAR